MSVGLWFAVCRCSSAWLKFALKTARRTLQQKECICTMCPCSRMPDDSVSPHPAPDVLIARRPLQFLRVDEARLIWNGSRFGIENASKTRAAMSVFAWAIRRTRLRACSVSATAASSLPDQRCRARGRLTLPLLVVKSARLCLFAAVSLCTRTARHCRIDVSRRSEPFDLRATFSCRRLVGRLLLGCFLTHISRRCSLLLP